MIKLRESARPVPMAREVCEMVRMLEDLKLIEKLASTGGYSHKGFSERKVERVDYILVSDVDYESRYPGSIKFSVLAVMTDCVRGATSYVEIARQDNRYRRATFRIVSFIQDLGFDSITDYVPES